MFLYRKYGTYILEFMKERSEDGYISVSTSSLREILNKSKISYNDLLLILEHYSSVTIYKSQVVWIQNEDEAKLLVDELNTLITMMGTRIIYL